MRPARSAPSDGAHPADGRIAAVHVMYATTRDQRLRDELIAHYDDFAVRLARGFRSRRAEREDLVQVARLGLIHAVDRFDPGRQRPFVAFARVTILGELKRHLRDHTWPLPIGRRLQEEYLLVVRTGEDLLQELGRSPRISEVAARAGLAVEQVLEAMEVIHSAAPLSLDRPPPADRPTLDPAADDSSFRRVEERQTLSRALARLPEREQEVIRLRFGSELSQAQIASQLGVSQMSVSRVLGRTLTRMRTQLAADHGRARPRSDAGRLRTTAGTPQ